MNRNRGPRRLHISTIAAAIVTAVLLGPPQAGAGILSGHQGGGDGPGRYELVISKYQVSSRKLSGRAWDGDGSYPDVSFAIFHGAGTGVSGLDRKKGGVHKDRISGDGPVEDRWIFDWDGSGSVILMAVDIDAMNDDFIALADIKSGRHPAQARVTLKQGKRGTPAGGTVDVVLAWKRLGDLPGMVTPRASARPAPATPRPPTEPARAVVARTGWSATGSAFGACLGTCRGGKVKGRKVLEFQPLSVEEWNRIGIRDSERINLPIQVGRYSIDVTGGDADTCIWQISVLGPGGLEAHLYQGEHLCLELGHESPDFYLSPDRSSLGMALAATPSEGDDAVTYYTVAAFKIRAAAAYAMNVFGLKQHKGKEFLEAVKYYTAALDLDPQYNVARYNRACAYAIVGNVTAAVQDIKILLSVDRKKYKKKIGRDHDFDRIRGEEEFRAAIR